MRGEAARGRGGEGARVAEIDVAVCAYCGTVTRMESDAWQASVNLTPDMLMVMDHSFEWGHSLGELDIAFDWCTPLCFAQWLFRACAELAARHRP